jgi:hypothetical protein
MSANHRNQLIYRFILIASAFGSAILPVRAEPRQPFSVAQSGGSWWLVKPNGQKFFSFGVCVVNQGASTADFNPTNPGYAAFKYYSDSNRWAEATLKRLKEWHFTTVGGWSDYAALKKIRDADVAFIPVLAVGMTCGIPWFDMWDTNIIARMHQVARDQILPLRDDPRLLGYYSDNEMGWWSASLLKLTLEQSPGSGQRQRLLKLLRETYRGDWSELLKDFEGEGVKSFEELDQRGMLYLRPGSKGIRVYRRFLGMMAERYYALVREVIRAYDSRGLILGDRYQSFYYPEVARACGPHVDAASGNLNAAWNDGTFPRYYLDTLHALSGKPILVSEYYMAARQNRSGNRNEPGIFPRVETQKERVAGFGNSVQAFLREPCVVGADWFQFYDEPTHGRGDGENYNFGLVDIHDRPYELLTRAAAALDLVSLKARKYPRRADASQGVPPAPRDPLGRFIPLLALKDWDRERGFVPSVSPFPIADLYLCWDKAGIYVGVYAQDYAETDYYRGKIIPECDHAEWIVSPGGNGKAIHARLGPGGPARCDEPAVRLVNIAGEYLKTRNIAAMQLPASLFGRKQLKRGDEIELASTFFTHARGDRVEWKGKFTLRGK